MQGYADLHVHTTYSDGLFDPEQIFRKARTVGLGGLSITDHDTVDGCIAAEKIKNDYDIDFIPGVELSCFENGKEYHVLGYNVDIYNRELQRHLKEYRKLRFKRAQIILEKLNNFEIDVDIDTILAKAGAAPITRPHIASVLVENGFTDTPKEAFNLYLGEGKPAYQAKQKYAVEHAIKLINRSGGVAVLAHPAANVTQETLYNFIEQGLDGIEVVHPMHDLQTQRRYRKIANQYWLLATGGSDFHGSRPYDEGNFGNFIVPLSIIESIRVHSGAYGR